MKIAMEMSLQEEKEKNMQINHEEEELMKRVMEISERDEKDRQAKI